MILALTESAVPLSVQSLGTLLRARHKREKIANYNTELLYLLAKTRYEGITPPNEFVNELYYGQRQKESDGKIVDGLIKKLAG